jgi:hypothetical protein
MIEEARLTSIACGLFQIVTLCIYEGYMVLI